MFQTTNQIKIPLSHVRIPNKLAKTSQQDMEPRCHSAFPLLESELLELQEDEESTDILPTSRIFFWGSEAQGLGDLTTKKSMVS